MPTLSLHEIQQSFRLAILKDEQTTFHACINKNGLDASHRLQVYRNNYFIGLTDALESIYPTIQLLVGENFFKATAREYIRRHPSASGNLHDFGEQFAHFLTQFPPAQTLAYLPEMAALEWAGHLAYHEKESPAFDLQKLATVPENDYGKLKFQLDPSCSLFSFHFAILTIWNYCHEKNEAQDNLNLDSKGENILVIRRQTQVHFELLTLAEWTMLSGLQAGLSLEDACAAAEDTQPDFDINTSLQTFLLNGTLRDFNF